MNCIQIGLPGKLILEKMSSGNHILLKIVSENRFSGKTYLYTIVSREDKGVIGGIDWNKSPTVEFKTSTGNREGDRVITVVDRGIVLLAAKGLPIDGTFSSSSLDMLSTLGQNAANLTG